MSPQKKKHRKRKSDYGNLRSALSSLRNEHPKMHPCRTQYPNFSGFIFKSQRSKPPKNLWNASLNGCDPQQRRDHPSCKIYTSNLWPKKAVNLSTWHCTPNTTATLWNHYFYSTKMTWTNYWQSGGQITDNKIRKRWSKYWLPSIYIYAYNPSWWVQFTHFQTTFSGRQAMQLERS